MDIKSIKETVNNNLTEKEIDMKVRPYAYPNPGCISCSGCYGGCTACGSCAGSCANACAVTCGGETTPVIKKEGD